MDLVTPQMVEAIEIARKILENAGWQVTTMGKGPTDRHARSIYFYPAKMFTKQDKTVSAQHS